jgi:diguanylate cyclase (GGDEF)-like protein
MSPVKKEDGMIMAVTVVSKDITDLKRMEERLRVFSFSDELTGLYNRRGFFALVEQQLKLSKRMKQGIFMLYADLDGLKAINDTWGHQEGDRALIDIANILKATFRESDIIGRIGGDEYVALPIGTAGDNVKIITDRLQKVLEIHNAESALSYKLSISFGVAHYDPENPCSIDELLLQGDKLMYEQKRLKRGLSII